MREVLAGSVLEIHQRTPDRDLSDCAAGLLRQQAIENIAFRIKDGKHRLSVHDLLDSELASESRYTTMLGELSNLLTAQHGEHGALADRIVDGLIERYISVHGDLVEEEANEIEASR